MSCWLCNDTKEVLVQDTWLDGKGTYRNISVHEDCPICAEPDDYWKLLPQTDYLEPVNDST